MRSFMSVMIVSSILQVLSFPAVLAAEPCDDDPLMPRIDKMMKKRLPLTLAWKLNPDKPDKEAAIGIWESEKTGLRELHELREKACASVLELQVVTDALLESINSIKPGKNCEDVAELSKYYSELSSQYKKSSDVMLKYRGRIPLWYETHIKIGAFSRFSEVIAVEGTEEARQIQAVIDELKKAWNADSPMEFTRKEGIEFFNSRYRNYAKLRNEAEMSAGTMKIQLQDLECGQATEN